MFHLFVRANRSTPKTEKMPSVKRTVSDAAGRPAQYQQLSRKGKKAWRKNIDLQNVEAAMEDAREQERVTGTPAHKRSDAELFVEDRSGQETTLARQAREKRKLRSQEILSQRSAVPAMHQKARSSFQLDTKNPGGKAVAAGIPEKLKKRLRILASRPHEGLQGESEQGSAGKFQSDAALASKHDLWSTSPSKVDNDWVMPAIKKSVHRPTSMNHEPLAPAKMMPAVSAPHPGTSYNPDFDSHEELVQAAFEKAKAEEANDHEKETLNAHWKGVARGPTTSLPIDMPIDVDDEVLPAHNGELEEGTAEGDENAHTLKLPGRKTAAQRRREARSKEQHTLAVQRRKERQLRAMMSEMPGHVKNLKKLAQKRAELSEQRQKHKIEKLKQAGMAGKRISKYAVPEQRMDVQTGDELSESLRQLKPEGNLFWDRFQNMQARGLVEARKPVKPKRRLKTKTYDRHTFKRDDI